jgi:hypothetical protein
MIKWTRVIITLLLFLTTSVFINAGDATGDNPAGRLMLNRREQNTFFDIGISSSLSLNNRAQLMYLKAPEDQPGDESNDRFFPDLDIRIQAAYHFPVNRQFSLGPSLFSQAYVKMFHNIEDLSYARTVHSTLNAVLLPGVSFVITPWSKVLDMPVAYIQVDAGPGLEINNNEEDGDGLHARIGGFSNQLVILPVMPIHLFVMNLNVLVVMAVNTPEGWFPGIRLRNYLLVKFAVFNFIDKRAKSGFRIYNIFSFVLTGKPSLTDLTSQYTYDKLYLTMFWEPLPGLEFNLGYSFEAKTFARDPLYHMASKLFAEIEWERKRFSVKFRYSLEFWDVFEPDERSIRLANPMNRFEVSLTYSLNRMNNRI